MHKLLHSCAHSSCCTTHPASFRTPPPLPIPYPLPTTHPNIFHIHTHIHKHTRTQKHTQKHTFLVGLDASASVGGSAVGLPSPVIAVTPATPVALVPSRVSTCRSNRAPSHRTARHWAPGRCRTAAIGCWGGGGEGVCVCVFKSWGCLSGKREMKPPYNRSPVLQHT